MTKEQFLKKWVVISAVKDKMLPDLEAVIAHEIAKVKEVNTQPALNPIAEAYERGEKIRLKDWRKSSYIKKQSKKQFIDERGSTLYHNNILGFDTHPEKWELYTEPTEQSSSQVKLDNSFDRERFESMFRAVVASGVVNGITYDESILQTKLYLTQLDAYYASKEGGNNE